MSDIKISIIIPAFNAGKYLERCLDSLLKQTIKEIEVIVINDGSTDNTEEICQQYQDKDTRIILYSKANEGQGIARNFGIQRANGEYIGFVDADDYVDKTMYKELYEQAIRTSADMVYSYMDKEGYLEVEGAQKLDNGIVLNNPELITYMRKLWLGGLPHETDDCKLGMSVCRSIFRSHIIATQKTRFISERIVNSEDLLFNLEFSKYCTCIATLNANHYHYCSDNPISYSVSPNPNRFLLFSTLHKKTLEYCDTNEDKLRCSRRYLANVRVIMAEKARWCSFATCKEVRKDVLAILNDTTLQKELYNYPIEKLPFMQYIYFVVMRLKSPILLILIAKLRYRLL